MLNWKQTKTSPFFRFTPGGLVLFLFLLPLAALSQSRLNFPRIDLAPDTFTGIAIVNPNNSTANVRLTLYQPDGDQVRQTGIDNPVDISIGPESQFANIVSDIFGSSNALAPGTWLRASSNTKDLTGFFLFLDPAITFFDGADLPTLSRELVFDSVRDDESYSTEVNLINPNPQVAQVTFRQIGEGIDANRTLEIPAFGSLRSNLSALFVETAVAGGDVNPSYLKVNSDQELGGFYFVQGAGDLLGLNARPASSVLNTLYFPQMTVLDPFLTELVVVSLSQKTELITVTAYQPDGSPFGNDDLQMNPVTRSLEAGELMRESLETLFGFSGDITLEGWLQVEATSSAIQGSLSYSIISTGSVAAVSSESRGRNRAIFSHIATQSGFFTGVALLNPGALAANVRVVALRPDGTLLGVFNTVLQPRHRISRLIEQLIPAAANQAGGLIFVRSDLPVFLTSLFGNQTGVLANIPPQPVPATFRPDSEQPSLRLDPGLAVLTPGSQQQFSISGISGNPSWTVNGFEGGQASTGTIGPQGIFKAPNDAPARLPITIGARLEGQLVGASVDVLSSSGIVLSRGEIQSLAYVESLQKLFTAELGLQGASLRDSPGVQGGLSTSIFDVTDTPQALVGLSGEEISKMVAYQGVDKRPYLLLASRTSGTIIRLDAQSGLSDVVVSGLDSPAAIVVDPVTGDLLVAEAGEITTVPAEDLNASLQPAQLSVPWKSRQGISFGGVNPAGIAVDPCNGDIYLSDVGQGAVLLYPRQTLIPEVVAGGLAVPGQLLTLNRSGVSCPDSLHLLVIDEGLDQVRLLVPSQGINTLWADAQGIRDLTFLPPNSPLAPQGGVLLAEVQGVVGQVENVPVANLYQPMAPNPDPPQPAPSQDITGQGAITASTTFAGFPKELSVDGDRTTSWFSGGSDVEGRNFSEFAWESGQEFVITQVSVLSNRDHPLFSENFGFDSITIRVFDGIAPFGPMGPRSLVFEQTISLSGTPDPDIVVFPEVSGNVVELTLTGHESPNCGGFAELMVFGRGEVLVGTPQ